MVTMLPHEPSRVKGSRPRQCRGHSGGTAGTAGGIKVTTFALLAVIVWAEMRGDPTVNVGSRQIPADNQRQALAVTVLGALVVAGREWGGRGVLLPLRYSAGLGTDGRRYSGRGWA